ncbi:aldolase/citrate lyase family protein [Frankia gtarii]|uniref:aldolase/citrate lyase family protein n=1 Tax=Frankia gtarii TaxID=2950102 RepID=UPI0021BDF61C|nr:aldolase/citrate lyase family protein [Frankia gtarii]
MTDGGAAGAGTAGVTSGAFRRRLRDHRPAIGMWVASGNPYNAEICAGGGLDWLLIDGEHAPNDVRSLLAQLQAVAPYPVAPVVRPPTDDPVLIKQLLDIGAENLLLPMVESAEQAAAIVAATRYPPAGIRGVGSAFARVSRWTRVEGYLHRADDEICVMVQIESAAGLAECAAIAAVDGVDGVFFGPADLAASLGHLGRPEHPDVVEAITSAVAVVNAAGKAAGVNAFAEPLARRYLSLGVRFILVGADVTLLARGSEELAARYRDVAEKIDPAPPSGPTPLAAGSTPPPTSGSTPASGSTPNSGSATL